MRFSKKDPNTGYIDYNLWIPKSLVNVDGLKASLTFAGKTGPLKLWKEAEHHLIVPRAFTEPSKMPCRVVDVRATKFTTTNIRSKIVLDAREPHKTHQRDAYKAMSESNGGILQLFCGGGKTVITLHYIALSKVPALIVVGDTTLLQQWHNCINQFLEVPDGVGLIQGPMADWKKPIVLATYQTLANRVDQFPAEMRGWFGNIFWDEAHHMQAPHFCKSSDLFIGKRVGLTATPVLPGGEHVIYYNHIGKPFYKNLLLEQKPDIQFLWTGETLDLNNASIRKSVVAAGELHLGKLSSYFATVASRRKFVVNRIRQAVAANRVIIVLDSTIAGCVNLLAEWAGEQSMYTDVPMPEPSEVIAPIKKNIAAIEAKPKKNKADVARLERLTENLSASSVRKKVVSLREKRRSEYICDLLSRTPDAGLMIGEMTPAERDAELKSKRVVFAIMKYGKEALDKATLDSIFCVSTITSKNGIQQLMGRVLRPVPGKQSPEVVFFEDDIPLIIGCCEKLRRHLRDWPADESGPLDYTLINNPYTKKKGRQ